MATENTGEVMADEGRGLLTDREKEVLSGEADVTDNYVYKVESVVRNRLRNQLSDDVEFLKEHFPEAYEIVLKEVTGRCHQIDDSAAQALLDTALITTEGDDPNVPLAREQIRRAMDVIQDGASWATAAEIGDERVEEGDVYEVRGEVGDLGRPEGGPSRAEVDILVGPVGEQPNGIVLVEEGGQSSFLSKNEFIEARGAKDLVPTPDGGTDE